MTWLVSSALATMLAAVPTQPKQPRLSESTARAFVGGGAVATALTLWPAGMASARLRDSRSPQSRALGRYLPIPVAGPIIAATRGEKEHYPLLALSLYQGLAISMLTIGAVSVDRHRRRRKADGETWTPKNSTEVLLMTQGITWLAVSWGMTFGFARERAKSGHEFSRRMQVPLVGGFLAAPVAPNYTQGYLGLTSSAVQIASATAVVFGAIAVSRRRRQRKLSVIPMPTRDGAQLVASMRF